MFNLFLGQEQRSYNIGHLETEFLNLTAFPQVDQKSRRSPDLHIDLIPYILNSYLQVIQYFSFRCAVLL